MKSTTLLASLAMVAAAISTPLVARDREHDSQRDRQYVTDKRAKDGFDHGMQRSAIVRLPTRQAMGGVISRTPQHAARS